MSELAAETGHLGIIRRGNPDSRGDFPPPPTHVWQSNLVEMCLELLTTVRGPVRPGDQRVHPRRVSAAGVWIQTAFPIRG